MLPIEDSCPWELPNQYKLTLNENLVNVGWGGACCGQTREVGGIGTRKGGRQCLGIGSKSLPYSSWFGVPLRGRALKKEWVKVVLPWWKPFVTKECDLLVCDWGGSCKIILLMDLIWYPWCKVLWRCYWAHSCQWGLKSKEVHFTGKISFWEVTNCSLEIQMIVSSWGGT